MTSSEAEILHTPCLWMFSGLWMEQVATVTHWGNSLTRPSAPGKCHQVWTKNKYINEHTHTHLSQSRHPCLTSVIRRHSHPDESYFQIMDKTLMTQGIKRANIIPIKMHRFWSLIEDVSERNGCCKCLNREGFCEALGNLQKIKLDFELITCAPTVINQSMNL